MLAVIGGSGLNQFPELEIIEERFLSTPYGECSAPLTFARIENQSLIFLPRHGKGHKLPPHLINYRANIWALKEVGVKQILAINAVGGMGDGIAPGTFVVPHQVIDYTWGREQSFNFLLDGYVNHIDFTHPYSARLRDQLINSLTEARLPFQAQGIYGCTQGPRLETAAEIQRLIRDGCDLVGMTAMPEAALARELAMDYAALCLVVNWGAGLADQELSIAEMMQILASGMNNIKKTIFIFAKNTI
ncbi:S-methyl-5'-thioinosine phosphorylase [Cellvibrio mixtus]|uniref:S-methyl-5'-thioinosine phosphorylase n=1 Tax=Cellvibrio mixtus TaxID=39650 RepID=UPI000586949C|nr:S-methyl-5'-thioinosine phosphorylase [Cellvibrio mixtus]